MILPPPVRAASASRRSVSSRSHGRAPAFAITQAATSPEGRGFNRGGQIVGSGTVSNYDRTLGSSCIAERRMLEMVDQGRSTTPFLAFGDRVRIEMHDREGRSVFGAIDQRVVTSR